MIRRGQTVILESTTFPGTTREHLVPLLEESGLQRRRGLRAGVLARARRSRPHRLHAAQHAEGRRRAHARVHRRRRRRLRAGLRRGRARSRRPRSPSSRSCSRTSSARSTSRSSTRWRCSPTAWGSTSGRSSTPPRPSPTASCASSPGPGMGGHCLPVDPFYLTWKAREYDLSTEFIELAGKVNQQMPYFCLEKAERALNDAGKPVKGSRILIVGVSYKARRGRHARVTGAEDHQAAARARRRRRLPRPARARSCVDLGLRSAELPAAADGVDLAIIVTAHPSVDHRAIAERAQLTLDLRGVTRGLGAGVAAALAALERVVGGALGAVVRRSGPCACVARPRRRARGSRASRRRTSGVATRSADCAAATTGSSVGVSASRLRNRRLPAASASFASTSSAVSGAGSSIVAVEVHPRRLAVGAA